MSRKISRSPLIWILIASSVFFLIFLLVSGNFLSKGGHLGSSHHAAGQSTFFSKEYIGVVEVEGIILDAKQVLKKLESFEENEKVKAVVVRINSPGGAVAPSQEIYQAIKNYPKPIVASMGSLAASGGYYIACGAKKIFANPGTITGSIGVIMEFANLKKLYDWAKIERYSIKTGKFKDAGSEHRAMQPEEKKYFQEMIDDVLVDFKQAVATGRNLTFEQVTAIADGRIFSGNQAKKHHLVDELGSLKDAIDEAARSAHLSGKPRVLYPKKSKKLYEFFLEDTNQTETSLFEHFLKWSSGKTQPALTPGIYLLWNHEAH